MQFSVEKMNANFAEAILNWQYDAPYDFYNNELHTESLQELLTNSYFSVVDTTELIGFFCLGEAAQVPSGHKYGAYLDDCIDIGLGMKPELTGQGFGTVFFSFILGHIQGQSNPNIRLTVAKFNDRAIHLYKKFGFVKRMEFTQGEIEFITMVRE